MRRPGTGRGFSLVEVAIAVGLTGGVIAVLLGLLAGLARQRSEAADLQTAAGMSGGITAELQRAAAPGFDAFASGVPVMTPDPAEGWRLVARRDGSDVRPWTGAESPERDQYFLVTVRRFPAGPMAYAGSGGALALEVVVAWPFRVAPAGGGAVETPAAGRRQVNFPVVLHR